jgi:hypothetical protein
MKTHIALFRVCLFMLCLPATTLAQQVNSGSNGSDGVLSPPAPVSGQPYQAYVINMSDHPDGIYQYTSVNIPSGAVVEFLPNANNAPVTWLVQGDCVIDGSVNLSSGQLNFAPYNVPQNAGGPGGWAGGIGGSNPTAGQGPGGGAVGTTNTYAGDASFATPGAYNGANPNSTPPIIGTPPGGSYDNSFLLPLMGGSGGGGTVASGYYNGVGGGGGGAILIAASGMMQINGGISSGASGAGGGGSGSGGAIRLVATQISGSGSVSVAGNGPNDSDGLGWIRFDTFLNTFSGSIDGFFTQGYQPIIIPAAGQGIQLAIASIASVAVPASPTGELANPDVVIPAQQNNPISVVVNCSNIPLGTQITLQVQPAVTVGATAATGPVTATGTNSAGTLAASTATISINMPRGGGIIYATAVTGISQTTITSNGNASAPNLATNTKVKNASYVQSGLAADGERFVAMEIKATLGGKQSITYLTQSGKRYLAN